MDNQLSCLCIQNRALQKTGLHKTQVTGGREILKRLQSLKWMVARCSLEKTQLNANVQSENNWTFPGRQDLTPILPPVPWIPSVKILIFVTQTFSSTSHLLNVARKYYFSSSEISGILLNFVLQVTAHPPPRAGPSYGRQLLGDDIECFQWSQHWFTPSLCNNNY